MTLESIYISYFQHHFPVEFDGTTYSISRLVSTQDFHNSTLAAGKIVTTPSDYGRLGHELSFAFEYLVNLTKEGSQSISFGSERMAYLAVGLQRPSTDQAVHLYFEDQHPFSAEEEAELKTQNILCYTCTVAQPPSDPNALSVYIRSVPFHTRTLVLEGYDAIAYLAGDGQNSCLHVLNPHRINPDSTTGIRFIRKRFSCAPSARDIHQMGRYFLGLSDSPKPASELSEKRQTAEQALLDYYVQDPQARAQGRALLAHSGLAIEAALFLAVRGEHPTFRFIKPTDPYGGTHALLNHILGKTVFGRPGVYTEDVDVLTDGQPSLTPQILNKLSQEHTFTPTAIFLESPSNPGQVVTDCRDLVSHLKALCDSKNWPAIPIVVDCTMASSFKDCSYDDWPVIFTQSASKSLSRGVAIGGIAYATHEGASYVEVARKWLQLYGNHPTERLLDSIIAGMPTLDQHTQEAHQHAITFANWYTAKNPRLQYCDDQYPGIHSPLVSFYLPPHLTGKEIDFLTACEDQFPQHFKYCVSYGQDNQLAYVTQPATSTHGSLGDDVVDTTQLRIAFASNCDMTDLFESMDVILKQLEALS